MTALPLPDDEGVYHPKDPSEVECLVQAALDNKQNLRVKASGHAWPPGIASGRTTSEAGFAKDPNAVFQLPTSATGQLNLKLDKLNSVHLLKGAEAEEYGFKWKHEWNNLQSTRDSVVVTEGGIFKVGAGTVLGTNEIDGGKSKLEDGVVWQMDKYGYAVFDLGGIYSQTMAGYLSTGAAGGSTTDSIESNVIAYNIVTYDVGGAGKAKATTTMLKKEGGTKEESDAYHAYATSMGLLGITVEVFVRGIPRFAIAGNEITTARCGQCEVDLFGDGGKEFNFPYTKNGKHYNIHGTQRSMKTFLTESKYTRLEWWPQEGVDRVVVWKAAKIGIPGEPDKPSKYPHTASEAGVLNVTVPSSVSFDGADATLKYPTPYMNGFLGGGPGDGTVTILEVLSSLLLTIIGNLNNLSNITFKLSRINGPFDKTWFDEFKDQSSNLFLTIGLPPELSKELAKLLVDLVERIGEALENPLVADIVNDIGRCLQKVEVPLVTKLYTEFAAKLSTEGGPQQFTDIWFEGLPMDKDVNYVIIPVVFSELWFPIERCTEVMKIVEQVFQLGNNKNETLFAIEFYAGAPSDSWLSASGPWPDSTGIGKSSVLRVDMYYFPYNSEEGVNPNDSVSNGEVFFTKIWEEIHKHCVKNKDNPIPFKFHLGKYSGDIGGKKQYKKQYKKWDDWHIMRQKMDPLSIFSNEYWSEKLDNTAAGKRNQTNQCCVCS